MTESWQVWNSVLLTIDLFRGACAVKGNVPVAGHVKRVDHGDAFDAFVSFENVDGSLFHIQI